MVKATRGKQQKKGAVSNQPNLRERIREISKELREAKKTMKEKLLELKKTHEVQLSNAKESAYHTGIQDAFDEAARKNDAKDKTLSAVQLKFEKQYVSKLDKVFKNAKKQSAKMEKPSTKRVSKRKAKGRKPSVKKQANNEMTPSFSEAA